MKSFGVSESLILSGAYFVSTGSVTEGWLLLGAGLLTGFGRFTPSFGIHEISKKEDYCGTLYDKIHSDCIYRHRFLH